MYNFLIKKVTNIKIFKNKYLAYTNWFDVINMKWEIWNQRGLFKSDLGKLINADVNGSLQIIKKVFPNKFSHRIKDYGFNPIRVGL